MNKTRNFIIGLFFTALLIFLLYTTWLITRPLPLEIQGEIEATQFRVASKIPGRIDSIAVKRGQQVTKGDFLFSISSPEIDAKLLQVTRTPECGAGTEPEGSKWGAGRGYFGSLQPVCES